MSFVPDKKIRDLLSLLAVRDPELHELRQWCLGLHQRLSERQLLPDALDTGRAAEAGEARGMRCERVGDAYVNALGAGLATTAKEAMSPPAGTRSLGVKKVAGQRWKEAQRRHR